MKETENLIGFVCLFIFSFKKNKKGVYNIIYMEYSINSISQEISELPHEVHGYQFFHGK